MSRILVVAEHHHGRLSPATAATVGAARAIGGAIEILVAGADVGAVAEAAAALDGVSRVVRVDDPLYAEALAEPLALLIVEAARGTSHVLAPATTFGKNVLPRAAALMDVQMVSDIVSVEAVDTFKRPIHAGNAVATVKAAGPLIMATARPTAFAAAGAQPPCAIEDGVPAADPGLSRFVERTETTTARPDLTGAKIVVAGGRGVGSAEGFKLVEALADALGGAVGATRAAVDAGFAPNDLQIGQTGKVIAPDLYVAVGISGAIQHLAGMKDSRVIVAINTDDEAPIMKIADYALVADLTQAVPALIEKLGR